MTITLNKAYDIFIFTIIFGLSESFKKILFKDLVGKIIECKVAKNDFFAVF